MTNSPTSNPTVFPIAEATYDMIIVFYVVFCLLILACGVTYHRAKTHKNLTDLEMKMVMNDYNKLKPSEVTDEKIKEFQKRILAINKGDIYTDLEDNIISPISDSFVGRSVEKAIFHTSLGRILVNAEEEIDGSIRRTLEYIVALQCQGVFAYYVSKSLNPSQTLTTNLVIIFVIYFLFMLTSLMKKEFIRSKMGGDMNIVDKDEADLKLAKYAQTVESEP